MARGEALQWSVLVAVAAASLSPIVVANHAPAQVIVEDERSEPYLDALDIIRVEGTAHGDVLGLSLLLAEHPGPGASREARTWDYFIEFALEPEDDGGTVRPILLTLFARALEWQAGPNGTWTEWVFLGYEQAVGSSGPITQLDREVVSGQVDSGYLRWTLDVRALRPESSLADWTVTDLYAESRFAADIAKNLYTRYGIDVREMGGADRAPGKDFARPFDPAPDADTGEPNTVGLGAPSSVSGTRVLLGASTIGLLAAGRRFLRYGSPFLAGLFTRITRAEALDHPRRTQIVEAVAIHPGITFASLRRLLGFGSGPLSFHLAVLENHGLILCANRLGRRSYTLPGARAKEPKPSSQESVYSAILRSPGAHAAQIATATGLDRSTVVYHTQHLLQQGRIEARREGRLRQYFPQAQVPLNAVQAA